MVFQTKEATTLRGYRFLATPTESNSDSNRRHFATKDVRVLHNIICKAQKAVVKFNWTVGLQFVRHYKFVKERVLGSKHK
jgi:hypothetical protein